MNATLQGDSVYKVTLHDNSGVPQFSNLTQVATGLRNAASLAIDPATGDLLLADNGIDGNNNGDDAWSADTLQRVPGADMGVRIDNFGYPYHYTLASQVAGEPGTRIDLTSSSGIISPLADFEPLVDPNLPTIGSRSQGASGFALAPQGFPAGLNNGVFIGFHGDFDTGGVANQKNPLLYENLSTGKYFDFLSNDLTNIGHIDEAISTFDSLFLADISTDGDMFTGAGQGAIYRIKSPTVSIFPQTATPATQFTETDPVELGVKFQSSTAGMITGLRFYKVASDTGPDVGSLWSSTGTLLAQAMYTNETASGWQDLTLSSPVPIAANTTYVVSYHTTGSFADTQNYFATNGVTSGPLTALSSGSSGGNGVYLYGPGGFPKQTYLASNYFADVDFSAGSTNPPPTISTFSPASAQRASVIRRPSRRRSTKRWIPPRSRRARLPLPIPTGP